MMQSQYFIAEESGDVTILKPHPGQSLIGVDLEKAQDIWNFFEEVRHRRPKVLLTHLPATDLSPGMVDEFWQHSRQEPLADSSWRGPSRPPSQLRAQSMISRLVEYFHTSPTCSVVIFQGEVDFDFFGLLLASDYRICSQETVFVNRILEVDAAPGSATLWFLARFLGYGAANELIFEEKSLTAQQALEMKLVNRIASVESLEKEGLAVANRLASKSAAALHSLIRAAGFLDRDLSTYLKAIGAGFQSSRERPRN